MLELNEYFKQPTHKITFGVIGAGGTGSHVLNNLARMHKVLRALGHPGIAVNVYDYDIVERNNIGRQLFYPDDEGKKKAAVIMSRINRSYGLDWEAYDEKVTAHTSGFNFLITCVDNIALRLGYSLHLNKWQNYQRRDAHRRHHYWIDIGNNKMNGQIYLSDPNGVFKKYHEAFPNVASKKDDPNPGGCNIINSLNAQELFINEFMANLAVDFIYRMLRTHTIPHNAIFADLQNYNIQTAMYLTKKPD